MFMAYIYYLTVPVPEIPPFSSKRDGGVIITCAASVKLNALAQPAQPQFAAGRPGRPQHRAQGSQQPRATKPSVATHLTTTPRRRGVLPSIHHVEPSGAPVLNSDDDGKSPVLP